MSRQDRIRCHAQDIENVSVPRIPMFWDVPSMTLQLATFWDVSLVIPQVPLFSADVFITPELAMFWDVPTMPNVT